MSPKQLWGQHLATWAPFSFLSVTWHGGLYGLGVQGVEVLIFLGALFLPSGSSVSTRFLIHRDHIVSFCTLVTILNPLRIDALNMVYVRVSEQHSQISFKVYYIISALNKSTMIC
jgi:hypothetical protein